MIQTLAVRWLVATALAAQPAGHVLNVAAAADLTFAMEELVAAFQAEQPGIKVNTTFGSSGNFHAQLVQHAPFDVFFSADMEYPRKLVEAGHALKGTEFFYGMGRLVVWVPNGSDVDVKGLGIKALTQPGVKRIALANPKHAPYGRAAVAALQSLGVYDAVKDKLVYGENVAQAAQFVQSGAADVGVIALSLATGPAMRDGGKYWEVPLGSYPVLEQGGVLTAFTHERAAAELFRAFVTGPRGAAILKKYGFQRPGE